jgi:hypothetical protein
MSERRTPSTPSTTDQILDLLLDALLERQAHRGLETEPGPGESGETPPAMHTPAAAPRTLAEPSLRSAADEATAEAPQPTAEHAEASPASTEQPVSKPRPGEGGWEPPPPLPPIGLGPTLGKLLLVLAAIVVLVNIPVNRYGTSLARIMPDTASLVIRDGLVLKGSGPDVYVLQSNRLRWISSLEAFEFFGYRWEQVHVVDEYFLAQFERGRPIHVLLKCKGSPHIYALENGQKRWIKDIPTLESEGYVWDDVKLVTCQYLRDLPDGPSIPQDAGPPPQP